MYTFRSRLFVIGGVVAIVLLFQIAAHSQTNRISGQVYGADRRLVPDVVVELLNDVNAVVMRMRTGGSGSYQFVGMRSGRFQVRARPFGTGYEEQTLEVEILNIVQGGRVTSDAQTVDFFLRSKKDLVKKPGAIGVVFAQEVPEEANKAYDQAIRDLELNRTEVGIAGLENAIKIFADYFYALDRLGTELLKKHEFTEAGKYFERAVAINAKSSNSWYGLSYVLYTQGNIDGSIEASKKAVTLAPESTEMNLLLGIAQRRGRQYIDSEKSLLKAKKLSNGLSADTSWNLALLYVYNLKNQRLAADELENYLKIKPDHPDAEKLRRLIRQFRLGV
jgi:tetratricopeptide (TPR) repeat protein